MSDVKRRNRILFLLSNMESRHQCNFKERYGIFLLETDNSHRINSDELLNTSIKDIVFAIPPEWLSTLERQIQNTLAQYID